MCSAKQPAKLAMLLLLALLLLCNGVGNVCCSRIHENSVDLHALLDFQLGITKDPQGALSNWSTTTHFCRWNGITCTKTRPFRVEQLNLTSQNLEGKISSSLGNLTFLYVLDLSYNSFAGTFPILNHAQQLQYLFVNKNSLTGIIPDALSNCSSLLSMDFSSNLFVGAFPPKIGFPPSLTYINFESNQLEGSIPNEIGQLQKLKDLLLGDNRLSGEFPHAILNLSASLQVLSLEKNMLGKTLPPNFGYLLPNLKNLSLHANMFEGHIPASLGNALGLQLLDLSCNQFTGKIPTSLGNLLNLNILNLYSNQLEARDIQDWEFLNALTNCRSLKYLSLRSNQLQGSIPQSVGNLSTGLENLFFGANNLSGQVPQRIGNLSALTALGLSKNSFSGTIEGWIGNLKSLRQLSLRSNSFTGPIPSSIGNLAELLYLYLDENEFNGPIPAILGNIPLQELGLSYNKLQGNIPANFGSLRELIILNLSDNSLQGDIPQFDNLQQLRTLDLSSNKLTGQIPDSLGKCYGLVTLEMNQNFLTGNIPISFGNLTILKMLNLSHNNLSGEIPLSLNKLDSLTSLDLSYNHLQGEIPRNGVFENTTAVSLEGNWGLCGGAMDLRMVPCTNVSRKAERRYQLIKVLIPIFGFMSLVLLIYFLLFDKKMRRRTNDTSPSLGENFLKVSYADLAQATTNFSESNLVGRGGYGSVYRGKLKESEVEVAVKVFDLEMRGAEKSFLKECEALRSIQHRNLLPIITACSTVDNAGVVFKALVYEFMPNGNLDTWLHHREDGNANKHLSLAQRLSIAVNMADALDYLHFNCGRPTIHCDLKPSNILLDDDMNALLGDFGIASFYQDPWSSSTGSMGSLSVGVKGTIGYIAPEYAGGGRRVSTSGDVYGFGIILLEMMTGKRPTDPMFKDGVSIVNFVGSKFPHEIIHVIDATLNSECKDIAEEKKVSENSAHQCLVNVLQVALSCTHPVPGERMDMKEVARKMHAIRTLFAAQKAQQYASSTELE